MSIPARLGTSPAAAAVVGSFRVLYSNSHFQRLGSFIGTASGSQDLKKAKLMGLGVFTGFKLLEQALLDAVHRIKISKKLQLLRLSVSENC